MAKEEKADITVRNLSDEDFEKVAESGLCATSLKLVNAYMSTVGIHGKDYATVPERVKAFRTMCPKGAITTEVIKLDNSEVVIKATVTDEHGIVLATGLSQESKEASYINKTSYVENCETSAVGRALGMLGIGCSNIGSAEEVANAINTQAALQKPIDKAHVNTLIARAKKLNVTEEQIVERYGKPVNEFNIEDFNKLMKAFDATEKQKSIEAEAKEVFG